ncbi:hypothetical protein GY45DRAFT_1329595 [Cubamyces sp. BRFM 1775]|nr:hypothetical protein GY45DRAFT_1329595 [Cubamyces sp. BRFM 1775]
MQFNENYIHYFGDTQAYPTQEETVLQGPGCYGYYHPDPMTLPMEMHHAGQAQLNPLPPEEYSGVNVPYQHPQAVGYTALQPAVPSTPSTNSFETYMTQGHHTTQNMWPQPNNSYYFEDQNQETYENLMPQTQPLQVGSPASGSQHPQTPNLISNHPTQTGIICYLCGNEFTRKWNMKKHIDEVHYNKHPYQCPHCPKKPYKRNHDLQQHIMKKHPLVS